MPLRWNIPCFCLHYFQQVSSSNELLLWCQLISRPCDQKPTTPTNNPQVEEMQAQSVVWTIPRFIPNVEIENLTESMESGEQKQERNCNPNFAYYKQCKQVKHQFSKPFLVSMPSNCWRFDPRWINLRWLCIRMHFTVDGRNPAPIAMASIPVFTGFCISQLATGAGSLPTTVLILPGSETTKKLLLFFYHRWLGILRHEWIAKGGWGHLFMKEPNGFGG